MICNAYLLYIPKKILLETNPWTTQNGLLTPSNKLCRPKLLQKYGLAIDIEYSTH
jgi:hypothetical protein